MVPAHRPSTISPFSLILTDDPSPSVSEASPEAGWMPRWMPFTFSARKPWPRTAVPSMRVWFVVFVPKPIEMLTDSPDTVVFSTVVTTFDPGAWRLGTKLPPVPETV